MATTAQSSSSQHWSYYLQGLDQAFNWPKTFILFYSSSTIQKAMFKLFVINGIIFLGGLTLLETFYNTASHRLFGCSYAALTGYPMYIALLGLNSTFYGQIAEKAYQTQTSRSNNRQGSSGIANTVQSMASTVYTIIFYINCGVFASLLRSIPTVGTLLSFLANCFIMSYYCFEYKWVYYGWTMEQRLLFVEQNWAYFLGFGLPGTVLTYFLSPLRSGAVFSLIYPSYVIMAMIAVPKSSSPYNHSVASGAAARFEWMLPNKLPLFYVVRKMNDLVILIVRLIGGVHADPIVSEKKKASMRKQE